MTPTIVFKDGKPFLVTGSPGGSRIITTVLQVIVNVIDHGMTIADAVAAPRIHHQWLPDEVVLERGLPRTRWRRCSARPQGAPHAAAHSANSILVTPRGLSAPPTCAPAAHWRRGIDESVVPGAKGETDGVRGGSQP